MVIVQIKLLVSTSIATAVGMSSISAMTSVTTVMDSYAESVVNIITSVIVLFTELSVVMRAVLVSISVAVLVMS